MSFNQSDVIAERYELVQLLGEGGATQVFECVDKRTRRRRAIRVLHDQLADDESVRRRVENSALVPSMIGSEHITDVLDIGKLPSGAPYVVTELLVGETLGTLIERQQKLLATEPEGFHWPRARRDKLGKTARQ